MFLAGAWMPAASADMIRFKNGSRFHGSVVKRTATEVLLKLDFGTASFTPEEILSIEPETPPTTAQPPAAIPETSATTTTQATSHETPEADEDVTFAQARKAVAFIATLTNSGAVGVGSGAIISNKGTIVTNYHVVANAKEIQVFLLGDKGWSNAHKPQPHEARVLRTDPCLDLAVISIARATPEYLRLAPNDEVPIGDEVRAIGNPEGLAVSVSKGIVSAVRTLQDMLHGADAEDLSLPSCANMSGRELNKVTWIQTDAAINPGNSGGPLLNGKNEIVGINSFIISSSGASHGLGFALHVKHVRKFAGGFVQKPSATPTSR